MSKNPSKRKCIYSGCKNWAMRDGFYCYVHRVPLQRDTPLDPGVQVEGALDDIQFIESEIKRLFKARIEFECWALTAEPIKGIPQVTPRDVVKVCGDVSSKLVQLLLARRALQPRADSMQELVNEVWVELESSVALKKALTLGFQVPPLPDAEQHEQ